ncbi:visual pigment-like receptor peropsin, partial [Saccoglossus kowalevskii]|uniref:Visual pigment-like receptor peropsin-like n=1 Tax=Saccoglossus kowalevskii TaxID=10224 RepID=A0ABM0MKP8_SACKO
MDDKTSTDEPSALTTFSESGNIVMGIFLLVTAVLSVIGNSVVLEMFRRYKELLSPSAILLISLALADLGLTIFGMSLSCVSSFAGRWLFGKFGCYFHGFAGMLFGLGSIGNLTVISIDRYIITCKRSLQWSYRHYYALLAVAWSNALFWSMMPLFGWSSYALEPEGTSCTIDWMNNDNQYISYVSCVTVTCFILPCAVMTYDYLAAYMKMVKAGYTLSEETEKPNNDGENIENIETGTRVKGVSIRVNSFIRPDWKQTKYATKMCIALVAAFLLSWFPSATVFLWAAFGNPGNIPLSFTGVADAFSKIPAVFNPVIYVALNPEFRKYFGKTIGCRRKRKKPIAVRLNGKWVSKLYQLYGGVISMIGRDYINDVVGEAFGAISMVGREHLNEGGALKRWGETISTTGWNHINDG